MRALVDEFKMDIMSRDFVSHIQHLACYTDRISCHVYVIYAAVCICALHVEWKDPISLCCGKKWYGVSEANGL